ncbi:MAG: terpene cyclase/mutase family protein [Lentisphaerae bacterium]|nr:terpene cyclase/mutase family protein [Lentisphaerota bacterium]
MLKKILCSTSCLLLCLAALSAQDDLADKIAQLQSRGAAWLLARQEDNGAWLSQSGQPAMTALACLGIYDSPEYARPEVKTKMNRALDYITAQAKSDGGIYGVGRQRGGPGGPGGKRGGPGGPGGRPAGAAGHPQPAPGSYLVYNTSICLLALAKYNRPQDLEICRKARVFLLDSQNRADAASGGIGYGRNQRADLSNTAWTLEALKATDHLDREPFSSDPQQARQAELAWDKALQFVSMCQNLSATNQSAWVKSAPEEDRGGFIYCPEDALKAESGSPPLRSYGSMTYAGIKSMIYAEVAKDDVRMQSAFDWVKKYYTLEENPGTGASGFYYYLHTFGKTLTLFQEPTITDSQGREHDWRRELVNKLAATQKPDGSWYNDQSGRWMENIPELSTAYCLMTLGTVK